jgi:uncharacterized protein involved in exopolysaccharide biosynthesis
MSVIQTPEERQQDYSTPPEATEDIDLLDLLLLFARRKKLLFQITTAFGVIAVVVSLLIPNRYEAITQLMPPQQNQSLATAIVGQLSSLGSLGSLAGKDLGLKNPNDIYVGMLTSRTVEDGVINRFGLVKTYKVKRMSDARKGLERRSKIVLGKEGFISVSYEDTDKALAAAVANGYVDELRKLMEHLAITEAGRRRIFFEQQVEEAKEKLADAEQELKKTQERTGLIDLSGQARALIASVISLRAQIAAKEVELQSMKAYATDDNPKVVLAQQQLAAWREQLAKIERQQGPASEGDVEIATSKVPQAGLEYIRRYRDVKYYETIFELLAKQYEIAKLDEAKDSGVVQVIDPAVEPDRKSFPPRTLIVALAILAGFICGCAIILFSEGLNRIEQDPSRATKVAELRSSFARRGLTVGQRK